MAGEYQLAQRLIDEGVRTAQKDALMDDEVLSRALMAQLIAHYRQSRSPADVASELEHHLRSLEDGDHVVVTRGC